MDGNPFITRPLPLSCKEDFTLDVPVTYEDEECLIDPDEVSPTHVEVKRMTQSIL